MRVEGLGNQLARFSILNLGCKVNRVESDDAAAFFLSAGWHVAALADADLIVVNTCTVTGEADKKARKSVRRALSANQNATVIVTGCAAAISPEVFEGMSSRVCVVPKAKLMASLKELTKADTADSIKRMGDGFNTRIGVKIQDGCAHACTYCIVHVARGKPWSKPAEHVCDEIRAYAQAGAKEVVLAGINLGSYRDCSVDLSALLRMLSKEVFEINKARDLMQGMRIRLSSVEPMDVTDDLIELLAESDGLICRHLHLPVQSGSTKVLAEMERPYTAEDYLDLISRLRAAVPGISLSTDIIAGFPGESKEDFDCSCALCERAGFAKMHVFPYSLREGTKAAERLDQIAPEEKAMRARVLRALGDSLRDVDFSSRAGTVERALVESGCVATTESYYEVEPPAGVSVNEFFEYSFV